MQFESRPLLATEQKLVFSNKNSQAGVFSLKRLHTYLYGWEFTLLTVQNLGIRDITLHSNRSADTAMARGSCLWLVREKATNRPQKGAQVAICRHSEHQAVLIGSQHQCCVYHCLGQGTGATLTLGNTPYHLQHVNLVCSKSPLTTLRLGLALGLGLGLGFPSICQFNLERWLVEERLC